MDLNTVCFGMFGFLFLGYLLLEGFDYGAGMLLPFIGNSDSEKQAILRTLAPVWEGNEVWLIAAGAVLFAGFPHVYATLFSGLYFALLLILVTLILRGIAFEFRDKDNNRQWRTFWDWAIFFGSMVPAFFWGIAITNLLAGLPIDHEMQYAGSFGDLLNLYSLTGGLVFLLLFLLHGSIYLTLRVDHYLVPQVRKIGLITGKYAVLVSAGFIILSFLYTDLAAKLVPVMAVAALLLSLIYCCRCLQKKQYALSFLCSTAAIVSAVLAIFVSLFPRVIVSSLSPDWSLTVYNSASNILTLKIMTITMSIVLPLVLAFEVWKYHIFRDRINIINPDGESQRLLWAQLHGQLMQFIAHAADLAVIMKKGGTIMESNVIKSNEALKARMIHQLQESRELLRRGRRLASAFAKLIRLLKK
ncbi:cytochrome d ubiquinol oxidase subunit II [Acetonema longum]|uniref:Cytochrome d ubiquinol oxidase subunit 2 n=1 Tax=Acetonema longum DSM 6540 TaxID=1009370 RepID=F7NHA8_9FIRM|nr:cytochrome d ubiquinol oxidase subunit II [Acetonema longum]EGO64591.1 cytochrome d ubiquinol oxidase subunit 2 [Acetonema longum DSM 6540]